VPRQRRDLDGSRSGRPPHTPAAVQYIPSHHSLAIAALLRPQAPPLTLALAPGLPYTGGRMPVFDLPFFGTLILCAVMVSASYTFAVSLVAGRSRPELLPASRMGVYATCALVAVAVFALAYAFQAHDFRIRYVMRYSDRSMPWWYLWSALWGGQDGSILWWSFLLCVYTVVCTFSLNGRLPQLQPYIYATLMSILLFFCTLMLFSANPFATVVSGAVPDGEGLNPLLQNYWMMIHPPMLYLGMVGWSVPFAYGIAALATGRLGDEWLQGVRRWTIFAWLALTVGNMLGMMWSYEELGWGGYWAWDPVENASFMPLLSGTAFIHSVMLQERRKMFKVWNISLLCLTFFMTIFGTFLTRSGMIASVHSFARSTIGIYFVWYMVALAIGCVALIIWRLPKLRAEHRVDSLLSRDFVFLLNNWILIGMLLFMVIATTFPLISEALRDETVTVGPGYYNKWMIPLGLILLALTGIGPLLAWRKTTGSHMARVLMWPLIWSAAMMLVHIFGGAAIGYPAYVPGEEIYDTTTGSVLAVIYGCSPVMTTTLCMFLYVGHLQEFSRGIRVRMKNAGEGPLSATVGLITRAKRRYGGYLVHMGIAAAYFGFAGSSYDTEKEAALRPGESMKVADFDIRYDQSRMEVDPGKRMIFTDMTVLRDGQELSRIAPAKFIFNKPRGTATTEVAIRTTAAEDIYAIMNTVNPESKLGTFRVIVRPFVAWIWLGGLLMIFGTAICLSPSVREVLGEVNLPATSGRSGPSGALPVGAAGILLIVSATSAMGLLSASAARADNQGSSSLHAGSVTMRDATERQLFERLLCECGDCQRLPLSTCGCGWAEDMRARVRGQLAGGETPTAIQAGYREEFGAAAISIPSDKGLDRALWAVPISIIALAAGGLWMFGRRMKARGEQSPRSASASAAADEASSDEYDERLERELRDLDG